MNELRRSYRPWNHDEGVQFVVKCNVLLFRLTVDPASAGPLSTACSSAIRAFFANQVANNERVVRLLQAYA